MKDEILQWLLEPDNASVRYRTMVDILNMPQQSKDVLECRKEIMNQKIISSVLAKQNEDGFWGDPAKFYTDKYKGTIWTLLLLAELYADPMNPQIKKACEFVLQNSYEPKSGGFSVSFSTKYQSGLPSLIIPCLTGNMVFTLLRLGYGNDERVLRAIDWIVEYQRADDGRYLTPMPKDYKHLKSCFSSHSCHMGVAKSLKALVEIPEEDRTEKVKVKIKELSEYFLQHHIYKKSHELSLISKPGWLRFGFPLMYQSDVLEIMELFVKLKIHDIRLHDAIKWIKDKSQNDMWIMENSFNGRLLHNIEKKGEPSKWLTMKAIKVLNNYSSDISE